MSTWAEDFADAMGSLGLPTPGEFEAEETYDFLDELNEMVEKGEDALTIGEAIENMSDAGSKGAAVAEALGAVAVAGAAAAVGEAAAFALTMTAATYAAACVSAALYASAKQGWEVASAPIDIKKLVELARYYKAPTIDLPVHEDVSWYAEVSHEAAPAAPDYPGTVIARNSADRDSVERIQTALEAMGYDIGTSGVDGDFGHDTFNAVTAFQHDHGLSASGEVNEETWTALFAS